MIVVTSYIMRKDIIKLFEKVEKTLGMTLNVNLLIDSNTFDRPTIII